MQNNEFKASMTNSKNMCKNWLLGILCKERIFSDSENTGQFLGENGI